MELAKLYQIQSILVAHLPQSEWQAEFEPTQVRFTRTFPNRRLYVLADEHTLTVEAIDEPQENRAISLQDPNWLTLLSENVDRIKAAAEAKTRSICWTGENYNEICEWLSEVGQEVISLEPTIGRGEILEFSNFNGEEALIFVNPGEYVTVDFYQTIAVLTPTKFAACALAGDSRAGKTN